MHLFSRKLKITHDDVPGLEVDVHEDTVQYIEDTRMRCLDAFVHCFNLVTESEIEAALAPHVTPNLVLVGTWMNHNMPYAQAQKRCREVHGLVAISKVFCQFVRVTPDIVLHVKEKTLYKLPDGTSFLVAKTLATGTFFLMMYMRNALTSSVFRSFVGNRIIFSSNSFFPKLFRLSTAEEEQETTRQADTANNFVRLREDDAKVDEVALRSEELSDQFFLHDIEIESVTRKRKPKRKNQSSMVQRNFFNLRKQKILVDSEVEVANEDTEFDVKLADRPSSYVVSSITVFHMNAEHKVYKVENFKRLDRKLNVFF